MDSTAARELELYIENDGRLYDSHVKPVIRNQEGHLNRGRWNLKDSIRGWMHVVDAGAKKYAKDFGGVWHKTFSASTRREVAKRFAKGFAEDHGIPTKHLVD